MSNDLLHHSEGQAYPGSHFLQLPGYAVSPISVGGGFHEQQGIVGQFQFLVFVASTLEREHACLAERKGGDGVPADEIFLVVSVLTDAVRAVLVSVDEHKVELVPRTSLDFVLYAEQQGGPWATSDGESGEGVR